MKLWGHFILFFPNFDPRDGKCPQLTFWIFETNFEEKKNGAELPFKSLRSLHLLIISISQFLS